MSLYQCKHTIAKTSHPMRTTNPNYPHIPFGFIVLGIEKYIEENLSNSLNWDISSRNSGADGDDEGESIVDSRCVVKPAVTVRQLTDTIHSKLTL
jgi:hypothetical protein